MKTCVLIFVLTLIPSVSGASNLGNRDVKAFMENAELCDHFAGEWDADLPKVEKKRIEQSMRKYCRKAKQQKRSLQEKYKGDAEIDGVLNQYESMQ